MLSRASTNIAQQGKGEISYPELPAEGSLEEEQAIRDIVDEAQEEERGNVEYAFQLSDGTIVSDKESNSHLTLSEKKKINPDNVAKSGFIVDGKFTTEIPKKKDVGDVSFNTLDISPDTLERLDGLFSFSDGASSPTGKKKKKNQIPNELRNLKNKRGAPLFRTGFTA